ncbi:MAG: tetratricopeptide repeat protein [bacterium]|jgi:thioredoxin-like negative regulator of GroEL
MLKAFLKTISRCSSRLHALALVLVLGQFFSCYSPQMAHYRSAQSLEADGKYEQAEAEYKLALDAAPDDAAVLLALARFYVNRDRFEDAAPIYTRFLEATADEAVRWEKARREAQFYIDKVAQAEEEKKPKKKEKKPPSDPDNPYGL